MVVEDVVVNWRWEEWNGSERLIQTGHDKLSGVVPDDECDKGVSVFCIK